MSTRISAAKRRKVIALIQGGQHGRNAVAREAGVGAATVTDIAREEGLSFDRTATKEATEARKIDAAARRADLSAELLEEAFRTLAAMRAKKHKRIMRAAYGAEYVDTLDFVPPDDYRTLVQAMGTLIDRHAKLDAHDAEGGDKPAVDAWLDAMTGSAASTPGR